MVDILKERCVFTTTEDAIRAIESRDVPKLRAAAELLGLKSVACIERNMPISAKDYARFAAYYALLVLEAA